MKNLSLAFLTLSLAAAIGCSDSSKDRPPTKVRAVSTAQAATPTDDSKLKSEEKEDDKEDKQEQSTSEQTAEPSPKPPVVAETLPPPAQPEPRNPDMMTTQGEKAPETAPQSTPEPTPQQQPQPSQPQTEPKMAEPQAPTPQPPTPPSIALPAETHLAQLFSKFLDETKDLDEVERQSGDIVAEVFSEDDQIRPKVWELRSLIQERVQQGKYTKDQSDKVQVLVTGLSQVVKSRERWKLGRDALIIAGLSTLSGGLAGYGHNFDPIGVARRAGQATKNMVEGTTKQIARLRETTNRLTSGTTYRVVGERVENWFARSFHKLTPEERLFRNLEALGLKKSEIELIKSATVPAEHVDIQKLHSLRYFPTNMRNLRVAALKRPEENPEGYGYLVFRQHTPRRYLRPGGGGGENTYLQTKLLSETELKEILSKMYVGTDNRRFVRLVTEDGETHTTRISVARFRDSINQRIADAKESLQAKYNMTWDRLVTRFDLPRATQVFIYTLGVASGSYALARYYDHDIDYADMYVESLLETPAISASVESQGQK